MFASNEHIPRLISRFKRYLAVGVTNVPDLIFIHIKLLSKRRAFAIAIISDKAVALMHEELVGMRFAWFVICEEPSPGFPNGTRVKAVVRLFALLWARANHFTLNIAVLFTHVEWAPLVTTLAGRDWAA
jgi:hypothetical protein